MNQVYLSVSTKNCAFNFYTQSTSVSTRSNNHFMHSMHTCNSSPFDMHPHSDLSVHALNVHINFMIVSCLRSFSTLIHNNSRRSTVTNLMPVTIQPHHINIQLQLTSTYHTNSTGNHIHIHCRSYSIQPLAGKVQ